MKQVFHYNCKRRGSPICIEGSPRLKADNEHIYGFYSFLPFKLLNECIITGNN